MKEAIKINFGGLQCDNPSCEYRDDTVKREEYESSVNKPCPECGENLLTVKDYQKVLKMEETAASMNKFLNKLPKQLQKLLFREDSKHAVVPLKSDGEGNISADMEKVYEEDNVD